ncbi:hypothetical protein ABTF08_20010, partial [Acinetobacter baumannii]
EERDYALKFLNEVDFDITPMISTIVEILCGSSKSARETAMPLVKKKREKARPILEQKLAEGAAAERYEAANALWQLFGADCAELLQR